jgi:hypothetical protein
MRDAEDKVMEELNRELCEAESSRAEPLSEMKERFCGLDWNGTLTREVAEALIEHVLVYDGGRLEIKWRFGSPIPSES